MTYQELKKHDRKAHSSLIKLWEELSRISRRDARKDLKEDWGFRYIVQEKIKLGKRNLIFEDTYSGDTFSYSPSLQEWI
jgi:hypothetical protein